MGLASKHFSEALLETICVCCGVVCLKFNDIFVFFSLPLLPHPIPFHPFHPIKLGGCSSTEGSLVLLADLQLELRHAALQLEQLHVKGGLLASQCRHLLLETRILRFLVGVVPLHLLLNLEVLVCKRLSHLLGLKGEDAFKGVLLRAEHLNLTLVVVQLLSQLLYHVLSS